MSTHNKSIDELLDMIASAALANQASDFMPRLKEMPRDHRSKKPGNSGQSHSHNVTFLCQSHAFKSWAWVAGTSQNQWT